MKQNRKMTAEAKKKISNGIKESWKKRRALNAQPVLKMSDPVVVKKSTNQEPNWKMIAMELIKTQLV